MMHRSRPSATIAAMKLQFSLATLLVWLTMLCASVARADFVYLSNSGTATVNVQLGGALPISNSSTLTMSNDFVSSYSIILQLVLAAQLWTSKFCTGRSRRHLPTHAALNFQMRGMAL